MRPIYLLAAAVALLAASPSRAAGTFVTKTVQNAIGNAVPTPYYDVSGTGVGPFVPVSVCGDATSGVLKICGVGSAGAAAFGPDAAGAAPSQPPLLVGVLDAAGKVKTLSLDASGRLATIMTPSAVLPIFDSRERLARSNAYFVFATGSGGDFTKGGLSVAAGQFLNVRTCNVGTKTAYITKRIFDMSATSPLAYGGVANPAALAGAQVSAIAASSTTGSNITVGAPASTTLQMSYSVGTGHVDNAAGNATATGTGYVYPNDKNELSELRIVPPGQCFGQYMNVPSGLTSGPYYLGFRLYEYEE